MTFDILELDEDSEPRPLNWTSHILQLDDYTERQSLGQGRFGRVCVCCLRKHETDPKCTEYAMRTLQYEPDHEDAADVKRAEAARTRYFTRELEIFLTLRPHPSICEFVGYCISPQLAIVMEYLPNGSLAGVLDGKAPIRDWTDTVRAKTVFGFACAMMHLHGHGAIHRYLTPRNILFDAKWEPRLVDFGFARADSANNPNFSLISTARDVEYVAPEAIRQEVYGAAVDVYAFGIIVWQLCSGRHPWPTTTATTRILTDIVNGIRPEISPTLCPLLAEIIRECWRPGPERRPTFAMIVKLLIDTDEKLFPGVDMVAYRAYRDVIFDATYQSPEARVVFASGLARAADVITFNAALADARTGIAEQQFVVARMYYRGIGVRVDRAEALRYYELAARNRHCTAQYAAAVCYWAGEGTPQDLGRAVYWMEQAAEEPNFTLARVKLAVLLKKLYGGRVDAARVIRLLQAAADPPVSFAEAQYELGRIYKSGGIVPADHARARYYLEMGVRNGSKFAANSLADMDIMGCKGAADCESAIRLFRQAMDRNLPIACLNLGIVYSGTIKTVPAHLIDAAKSRECFERGTQLGEPGCMTKFGMILTAQAKDASEPEKSRLQRLVLRLFKKASDLGSAIAAHNYGKMKVEGFGGPLDLKDGINHLLLGAERNIWQSLDFLARLWRTGTLVPRDTSLAARLEQRRDAIKTLPKRKED
jgi:TPR repeat protein